VNSAATIISRTELDTGTFLALANQILGRELNERVDQAKNLASAEARFVSFLTSITTPNQSPGLKRSHADHCWVGVLGVCSVDCIEEVTTCLSGLSLLVSPTVSRDHTLFIASGNLQLWREVVITGLNSQRSPCCREVFDLVRQAFVTRGLDLWNELKEAYDQHDCLYLTKS